MKKLLLALFAWIAFLVVAPTGLTSCTKESIHDTTTIITHDTIVVIDPNHASSVYYVKATVDGSYIEYRYNTSAQSANVGQLSVVGETNKAIGIPDKMFIGFYILDNSAQQPVTLGVYTNNSTTNSLYFTLTQDGKSYSDNAVHGSSTLYNTCTITAIDNHTVSGTFSGIVYNGANTSTVSKTITNGSFYVPF